MVVLSSSRGGERSYESAQLKNGFYTRSSVRALASSVADADGAQQGQYSVPLRRCEADGFGGESGGTIQNDDDARREAANACIGPIEPADRTQKCALRLQKSPNLTDLKKWRAKMDGYRNWLREATSAA